MATEKNSISETGVPKKKKNLHVGHRARMKDKLLNNGLESFSDHEILEFFLYYALPYVNTNDIAHELIDRFGSLNNAINADYEMIQEIKGLGSNAASMFYFFRSFASLYLKRENVGVFDVRNRETMTEYCRALFINANCEEIRMIYLMDNLVVLKDVLVCTGTPGKVNIAVRKMTKDILDAKINRVVLTHNHPRGACIPSRADVDETLRLFEIFNQIDVELIDHIIIGTDGEWSMRFDHTLSDIWKEL